MSEKTSTAEIRVRLIRAGAPAQELHLPDGTTLADLLGHFGATLTDESVLVDGVTPEAALALHDNAVVTIVARSADAAATEPWRATVPAFRDDDLFREYTEALSTRRRSQEPDESPSA